MIEVYTRTKGKVEVFLELKNIIKDGLTSAWKDVGQHLQKEMRKRIRTGSRSGRTYTIKGRKHRASAPGEYAANITGRLAQSVRYKTRGWEEMEFGFTASYAKYLDPDFKVRAKRKKLLPRPMLTPLLNDDAFIIERTLLEHVDRNIKK